MSRQVIIITADLSDDPNDTEMTVIEMKDQMTMKMHGFHGFAAHDIYTLLTGKGEQNEQVTEQIA